MKKYLLVFALSVGMMFTLMAQTKPYVTIGSEMIFSLATINYDDGGSGQNILRWSPVFNLQVYGNFDVHKNIGFLLGGTIRNVGFINGDTDPLNSDVKKKHRTYNFGIPIGFKIGNLDKFFVFGGYELEFPFHYKEKTFINGDKQDNKITSWFSNRVPTLYNTAFFGIQFPYGLNLKFKYYFTSFFNESYTTTENGVEVQPYLGYKANVYYFSLSFALFRNNKVSYTEYKEIY